MARPRTDIAPRIIRAARKAFAKSGVDGTSLREIARRASTSIGMVYYYFPAKDDLFYAVVEEVYAKLLADLEEALASDVDVATRILRLYTRIGAASELELTTIRLVLREMLVSSTRRGRLIGRFKRGHVSLIVKVLLEGVRQGRVDPELHPGVLLLSTFGLGGVPQLLMKAVGSDLPLRGVPRGRALSENLVHVLFHGIAASKPEHVLQGK